MPNDNPLSSVCKPTRRVLKGGVDVVANQHLHYVVTVDGAQPMFSLACKHKTHFDAQNFGPPQKKYDIVWARESADDLSPEGEDYTFSMLFTGALKYTLLVELHDSEHNSVGAGVVIDADYESTNPTALCNQGFVIRIV